MGECFSEGKKYLLTVQKVGELSGCECAGSESECLSDLFLYLSTKKGRLYDYWILLYDRWILLYDRTLGYRKGRYVFKKFSPQDIKTGLKSSR